MSAAQVALLPDRGVVSVTGEDAAKLLAGIVTNDVDVLDRQPAMFAGLLTPQGKILFDFLVARQSNGFLLDVARDQTPGLVKRLVMYRLRAKVDIADVSDRYAVTVRWGGVVVATAVSDGAAFVDPRHAGLGLRMMTPVQIAGASISAAASAEGYHAHRIAAGIPEGGKDYDFSDAFPHEANFDLLNGVSFTKGCYVGQEIVSRMEHRGTVRKRIARVSAAGELSRDRPDVLMGDVVIGKLGSVAGDRGLALLRLDRAIEAIDKAVPLTAADREINVDPIMIDRQRKLMAQKAGPA